MYITPNPSAVEPTFIHCLLISLSGERFASCRFEWFSRVVTSHARVFMAVLFVLYFICTNWYWYQYQKQEINKTATITDTSV